MAQHDQLEVVAPTGELLFFDLDESRGVTNIGRNPSNDVVLNGPGVADFHLMIDLRTRPYQVSILHAGLQAMLGNQVLEPNRTYPLHGWDTIMVSGFAVILVEGDGAVGVGAAAPAAASSPYQSTPGLQPSFGASAAPVAPPLPSSAPFLTSPAAPAQPVPVAASAASPQVFTAPSAPLVTAPSQPAPSAAVTPVGAGGVASVTAPASAPSVITPSGGRPLVDGQNPQSVQAPVQTLSDIVDETIVLEISTREVTINVDETATWQLSVANGGRLVARFEVHVEGWIDGSWVTVDPAFVNLYEGGRGIVNIAITPPRLPTSRAGMHQLAVVVTSPNYPGARAQRAITMNINPYYEFNVGDVNPRQQTVNYFRRVGHLRLPVQNRGNSEMIFRLEGADDENLITFEMDSPSEQTRLVRQIEFPLGPNQSQTIPISATPRNHPFIGVGAHTHSLTLTTTMLAPQPTSRSVLAQLRNRPVVGPWLIFAVGILLAAIVIFLLQPSIESFTFAPGVVQTSVEGNGQEGITAQGAAAQAANLQGKKVFGITIPKLPKLPKQLDFLKAYWPGGGADDGALTPTTPTLAAAMVDAGNEVTLVWDTRRATNLTIEKIIGGETQFVASIENPSQQGQYTFSADTRERATYVLTAHNPIERLPFIGETFGRDEARLGLIVDPVQPVIDVFEVDPKALVTGQTANISWQVSRAQSYELVVNGVPRPLDAARGTIQEVPPSGSTEYQLVAHSPYWDEAVSSAPKVVISSLPTPVINNFDVQPQPIVDGDNFSVAWDVAGAGGVTIDPLPGDVPNLQGQQEGKLDLGKTQQTFTLLATQGDGDQQVRAVATRVVQIVQPTPTPTLTPTPTSTPVPPTGTPTPIPTPAIRLFDIAPKPIIDGQNVQVSWSVEGASEVSIAPVPGGVNLEGQDEVTLDLGKSQETFTLRAVNSDGIATVVVIATRVIPIVTATPTVTPTPTQTPTATPQMPVIQVFTLSPREVVRGDQVQSTTDSEGQTTNNETTTLPELSWTVVGDATMVEITAPDFGPVRNLPKQGTLRVPATDTTVYQLNVYLGEDIVTSMTQELTVLEPTPTPTVPPPPTPLPTNTPTATPTATPNIVSFTVNAVEDGDVVAPISSGDDIPTYQVVAGTLIRLAWRIENPVTEVRLTDSSNDYGARSPEDEFQLTITSSTVFQLTVTGSVSRRIRINVEAIPPPPSPFNVNGVNGENNDSPATVTWDYPGESQGSILGFRIYRASIDNFNFTLVADRFELGNTLKEWTDPSLPSCDRVYYVVGVYEDITRTGDDRIRETAISPTSWYTRPCE